MEQRSDQEMMKLVKTFALILTFSPGRRDRVRTFFENWQAGSAIAIDWTSFRTPLICQATGDASPLSAGDLSRAGSDESNSLEAKALRGPSERARASHWDGVRASVSTDVFTVEGMESGKTYKQYPSKSTH